MNGKATTSTGDPVDKPVNADFLHGQAWGASNALPETPVGNSRTTDKYGVSNPDTETLLQFDRGDIDLYNTHHALTLTVDAFEGRFTVWWHVDVGDSPDEDTAPTEIDRTKFNSRQNAITAFIGLATWLDEAKRDDWENENMEPYWNDSVVVPTGLTPPEVHDEVKALRTEAEIRDFKERMRLADEMAQPID